MNLDIFKTQICYNVDASNILPFYETIKSFLFNLTMRIMQEKTFSTILFSPDKLPGSGDKSQSRCYFLLFDVISLLNKKIFVYSMNFSSPTRMYQT